MGYDFERYVGEACPDLGDLIQRSESEGHEFVERTKHEWEIGLNRFDGEGEGFFIAKVEDSVVGMCGLNRDPYLDDKVVGRLRHLYVHPAHRRNGVAEALVACCLSLAPKSFERVRLRTSNPAADALYRSIGFIRVKDPTATHEWRDSQNIAGPS